MIKRNIAYKVWMSQLLNNRYVKQDGEFEPDYIELNDKKISRVNIIGTVISKFSSDDGSYSALTIDDGSSEMRIKTWREDSRILSNVNKGDLILVIAKVREYNNEIYLIPNIIRVLDDKNWEIARKFELVKEHGFVKKAENGIVISTNANIEVKKEYTEEKIENVSSDAVSNDVRNAVLGIINKLAGSDGISITEIASQLNISQEEADNTINDLIRDGEIYKSRAGVVNLV